MQKYETNYKLSILISLKRKGFVLWECIHTKSNDVEYFFGGGAIIVIFFVTLFISFISVANK